MKPFLLILSAPTGAGKTTIATSLAQARPESVAFSISATTREPRPGEEEGKDYFFLTRDEFVRRRDGGAFLEWAEYGGQFYATPLAEIERILGSGRHVLLDIEVQGAHQIRQQRKDVVSIFILPPTGDALLERLKGRGTDHPADVRRRLERAVQELEAIGTYDYVVINDDRDQAIRDVAAILDAEGLRRERADDSLAVARAVSDALRKVVRDMRV